jgi:hypothetical protein
MDSDLNFIFLITCRVFTNVRIYIEGSGAQVVNILIYKGREELEVSTAP